MENIGYGTILVFGMTTAIGGVAMWAFAPETKGLSLEEMDVLFSQSGFAKSMREQADVIIEERRMNGTSRFLKGAEDAQVADAKEVEVTV